MALIQNVLPPSKENWELIVYLFQFFPLITIIQWITIWYPAGKSSINSKLNIPGKIAWITMEVPGFITLLYCMYSIPKEIGLAGLPTENKTLAGLFVIHYLYRAILGPLLAPSMSPIHLLVWAAAFCFQVVNGISIGGYLAGYGPVTRRDWHNYSNDYKTGGRMELGMMIWALGLLANIFHDDELREIRRQALKNQKVQAEGQEDSTGKGSVKVQGKGVDKVYMMPQNGLFWYILYPHYLCEWIEWAGFWIMAGAGCVPARNFLFNEIATMLPRAIQGRQWYLNRFGVEKVAGRKAVIPGIL